MTYQPPETDPADLAPSDFDAAIVRGIRGVALSPLLNIGSFDLAVLLGVDPDRFDDEVEGRTPLSAHTVYRWVLASRMHPMDVLGDWRRRDAFSVIDTGRAVEELRRRLDELRKGLD